MSRILLGVSASVACYKACTLASRLKQRGHDVTTVLTKHAAQLVSPQLFQAITGERAYVSEFDGSAAEAMPHIDLASTCDAFVIAPATANVIARVHFGLGEDLLTTVALVLGDSVPRWFAPAMNPRMYANARVQRNVQGLVDSGWVQLGPDAGWMACGDEGPGRLLDPEEIARVVHDHVMRGTDV